MKNSTRLFLLAAAALMASLRDPSGSPRLAWSSPSIRPEFQNSTVSGTTETFDGFSTGQYSSLTSVLGTFTAVGGGNFSIVAADAYGGAGGTGNYIAIGAQAGSTSPVQLTLTGPQAYFGIWVSAADQFNQMSFYSGNQLVGSYDAPAGLAALNKLPNAGQYYGNPNNGADKSEPFGYLNFTGTNGTTFTSIVLANSGTTATGFESDNWTVAAVAQIHSGSHPQCPGAIVDDPRGNCLCHYGPGLP